MDLITQRFHLVELDNGDQEFFDSSYQAFSFAKQQEAKKPGSVEYVAIGLFYGDDEEVDGTVYKGSLLEAMIGALDNTNRWVTSMFKVIHEKN